MHKKLQVLFMLLGVVGLFVYVIPSAFMQYPLPMQVMTFWAVFALAADRLGGKR